MGRKEITTKEDLMKVIELVENTGNWQITTFLTTKHGFPARIQKSWKR